MGDELWEELVEIYLEAHPSRGYTLNRLGDHLPDFVPEIEGLPRAAFLQDLARYELALPLSKPAFRILESLANGNTLGEAIRGSCAPKESRFEWFQQWVGEGLFQRFDIGEPTSRTEG